MATSLENAALQKLAEPNITRTLSAWVEIREKFSYFVTLYLVCEIRLPSVTGYNHSQEYLGQNLGLGPSVQQAFVRCTPYFFPG